MLCLILLTTSLLSKSPEGLNSRNLDTVLGKAILENGNPVTGGTITLINARKNILGKASTDSSGSYRIIYTAAPGDSLAVGSTVVGYRMTTVGFVNSRGVNRIDLTIRSVTTLPEITVQTYRQRPGRDQLERDPWDRRNMSGSIVLKQLRTGSPDQLALMSPGVFMLRNGEVSAGGLAADQNQISLDGMRILSNGIIPSTNLAGATTSPDIAMGGAGVNVALRSFASTNIRNHAFNLLADLPVGTGDGASRTSRFYLSEHRAGALISDRLFYQSSVRLSRSTDAFPSLLNPPAWHEERTGLNRDSLVNLLHTLRASGLDPDAYNPRHRATTDGSFMFKLHSPRDSARAFHLNALVSWRGANGHQASVYSVPSSTGKTTHWNASITGSYSWYTRSNFLNESGIAASVRSSDYRAQSRLPGITTTLQSTTPSGLESRVPLSTGGARGENPSTREFLVESFHQVTWNSMNGNHRWTTGVRSSVNGATNEHLNNPGGSYWFSSLADLAANQPSRYERQFDEASQGNTAFNIAVYLSDRWRAGKGVTMWFGLRAEHGSFLKSPATNSAALTETGVNTSITPRYFAVSPRFSVQWANRGYASRPKRLLGTASLNASVGIFNGTIPVGSAASLAAQTGIAGARKRLICSGEAIPSIDWTNANSWGPESCLDGTPLLSDSMPAIRAFSPDYRPPSVLKMRSDWTGNFLKDVPASFAAEYSYTKNKPVIINRNFPENPAFTLPAEGGRFVGVPISAIDTSDATISPGHTRVFPSFGPVFSHESSGRQQSLVLETTLQGGEYFKSGFMWQLQHSWMKSKDFRTGWELSGASNPNSRAWARSELDGAHQGVAFLRYKFGRNAAIDFTVIRISRMRYTPLSGNDVNGDGYFNDAAFVPTGAALISLLQSVPAQAGRCLRRMAGKTATPNSCVGPGYTMTEMSIELPSPLRIRSYRSAMFIYISDPISGLDRIVNGRRNSKGWGDLSIPNPILMLPTGFDPGTSSYQYLANGAFGRSVSFGAVSSSRISVGISFSGPPREEELMRLAMTRLDDDGKRIRRLPEEIKKIYMSRSLNLFALVYQYRDSVGLSEEEKLILANGSRSFTAQLDTIWGDPAHLLATMQPFKSRKALDAVDVAAGKAAALTIYAKRVIADLLNSRTELLPRRIAAMIALPKGSAAADEEMYDGFENN